MFPTQNVARYQMLSAGAEPVESQLQASLVEYLNAELVLRTVSDVAQAVQWLKTTFFAVRVRYHSAGVFVTPFKPQRQANSRDHLLLPHNLSNGS